MLHKASVEMSLIQEKLGHIKLETTLVYAHNTDKMRNQMLSKIEELYKKQKNKK